MKWVFFLKGVKCFCGGCGVVGDLIWGLIGGGGDVLEGAALLPSAGTVLSFAFCVKYWVR